MRYIEIAKGSPKYRGTLIPLSDLRKHIDTNGTPLYRSLYTYDKDAIEYVKEHRSLRNFYGERAIDKILIDIDKQDNSDEYTLDKARSILSDLEELDVPRSAIQPYFSGSGYHLILHNDLFNFAPSIDLPYAVKSTIRDLFPIADLAVLIRTAIYRVAHTKNQKTGLYKVPLTVKELMHLNPREIKVLAETPRFSGGYIGTLMADGELEEYVKTSTQRMDKTRNLTKVREPNKIIPCIQEMLTQGPQEGSRNNIAMRIGSAYKRAGIPSQYAKVSLLHWNDNQVEPNKIIELTERVYNNPYQYSCNDEYMVKHCKTRCIHFKNKDYTIEVTSIDDLLDVFLI